MNKAVRRRGVLLAQLTVASVAVLTFAAAAAATSGSLPGGTNISVDVVSPADGATVNGPAVPVSGTASVGQGAPVANTALIYVLDVSGSTDQAGGCGGDQNGDGMVDAGEATRALLAFGRGELDLNPAGDSNGDGMVDAGEATRSLLNFGRGECNP